MKRKEMIEFAQTIVIELYEKGFAANLQEAISTNSIYIHTLQSPSTIRISDHGTNNGSAKYNFLPSQKNNSTFKKGKYYYPMTQEGIEEFLYDFDGICPIIKKIETNIAEDIKTFVIKHKQTNTYLIENSTTCGRGIARLIEDNKQFITEDEKNYIHVNFRTNIKSAQVFNGKPNLKEVIEIKNIEEVMQNYIIIQVEKNKQTNEINII